MPTNQLEEITKEQFYAYKVFKRETPGFTEKAWFKHGHALGVILLDEEGLWGMVALAKDESGQYRAVYPAANFETMRQAKDKLLTTTTLIKDQAVMPMGPVVDSPEELVGAVVEGDAMLVVVEWALAMTRSGKGHFASSIVEVPFGYVAVVHPIDVDPSVVLLEDPGAPMSGPHPTIDAAKKQGSALLTFIMNALKKHGFKAGRTKN
jgi:hypothetical protein